ncbi:hypothetical protein ACFOWE_08425 [Planomonospora corallina]|uniref:Uncharacterized protein n=1 Tax=Planomonospora corallina TaxID=1806052 RepID=A0ABV8I569_9ACTN
MSTFEDLVAEGEAVPVEGWDFSWFTGRATEQRPPWGYAKLLAERMAQAEAALDVPTGGGEVLASIPVSPPFLAAEDPFPGSARSSPASAVHFPENDLEPARTADRSAPVEAEPGSPAERALPSSRRDHSSCGATTMPSSSL